ncbi:MAG TPA: tetratricopeptide repeat protein, partial [Candidatus Methylacidiphilales bacterium]|nr:tetratricopeptide repeat protein [Candidatus Methylacidiphilales bacterium]
QAMAEFRNALEINPNDAEAHRNLGDLLLRLGRADEAAEQYESALQNDPHYAGYRKNAGKETAP